MKLHWTILFLVPLFLSVSGCSVWKDLTGETRARYELTVDSLHTRIQSLTQENTRLQDRIINLERTTLTLDDRNRQLTARLAEIGSLPPPPQIATTGGYPSVSLPAATEATGTVPPSTRPETVPTPEGTDPVPSSTPPPPSSSRTVEESWRSMPTPPSPARPSSSSPTLSEAGEEFLQMYQTALAAFNRREFERAGQQFLNLLRTYEPNDLSDNCEYWIGESRYALGEFEAAVESFTNVLRYVQSDKTDDALLMRGNAWLKLKQPEKARKDFQRLIDEFPKSEFVERARQKLRGM